MIVNSGYPYDKIFQLTSSYDIQTHILQNKQNKTRRPIQAENRYNATDSKIIQQGDVRLRLDLNFI